MEERKEPKLVHRLIPCPQYDVSGMECWLSDMAKQGYLLQKDGLFVGIALLCILLLKFTVGV